MWPLCLHSDPPTEWPSFRSASIHPPPIQTCLLYGNISWISYPGVTLPAAAAAAAVAAPKGSQNVQRWHRNVGGAQTAVIGPWQPSLPQLPCTFFSKRDSWGSRTCVSEPCCTISRVETCLHFSFGYSRRLQEKVNVYLLIIIFIFFKDGSDLSCLWSMLSRCGRGFSPDDAGELTFTKISKGETLILLDFLWGLCDLRNIRIHWFPQL